MLKRTATIWMIFGISILLVIGSIAVVVDQNNEQAAVTRGWELATQQETMPQRGPIAGINVELTQYAPDELVQQLDNIASLGITWVRQPFYWADIEPEPDLFDWASYDLVVAAIAENPQLELIAVLDGTPAWARHELAPEHPFAPPASASQYAEFAIAVAGRYADTIDYYQIWDEPNLRSHWGNTDPKPALYVAMLQTSYPAIHAADATSSVIAAALAPTVEQGPENYNEITYLRAMYEHGAGEYFDAAAGKPYGFNTGPDNRDMVDFSRIILMREEMVAQGDGNKPLWGSNFGWNHLSEDWIGPPSIWGQVSADEQIQYTRMAYQRAIHEWPWLRGLILQHWQPDAPLDDPIQGFAVAPHMDRWRRDGPLVNETPLMPGLYPVQNPYVVFEGEWQFGPLGADALPVDPERSDAESLENTVTVRFYGTDFALLVRRYSVITGYYIVIIDGQNANALPLNRQGESHIVLKAVQDGESLDLIEVATGLDEGEHVAVIKHRPRQGDDAWALAGIAVAIAPDVSSYERLRLVAYVIGTLGLLGLLTTAWRVPWKLIRLPSRQSVIDAGDTGLTLLLSIILVVGVALSWGDTFTNFLRRDPPAILLTLATVGVAFVSPLVIITFLALLAFAIVVFNRPAMGLLAVIFWSMFFASTIEAYIRLITVVEAMLVISAVAIAGRGIVELARHAQKHDSGLRTSLVQHVLSWRLSRLDLAMLAFVGLSVLSIAWADLQAEAIHELRVMILGPALFYLLLRQVRLSQNELGLLVDVVIIGGTLIAVLGLRNYLTGAVIETGDGSRRLIAVYGSPNAVALQLGRCLPFALAYVLIPVGEWRRVFGGVAAALMLVAFLGTQSIGGILLGLPMMLTVILLGWQGRRMLPWLAGVAASGAVALLPLSRLVPRLRTLTDFDNSTTFFRLNVWRSTVEMLKDYPLTGVGLDQFLYAYRSRYILPEGSADPDLSHPHNFLLDYWVRLGVFGVVIGVWIQVLFWRVALATYRRVRDGDDPLLLAVTLGAMGMMAYFLAHGMVDIGVFFINLSYFLVLVLALMQRALQLASVNE